MPKKPSSPAPSDKIRSLELRVKEIEYSLNELIDVFDKAIAALIKIPCSCDAPPGTCRLNVGPRPRQKKTKG